MSSRRGPIDTILELAGPGSGSPPLSVELRLLGGALREAPLGAGAVPGLDPGVVAFSVGMVMSPEMGFAVRAHLGVVERGSSRGTRV